MSRSFVLLAALPEEVDAVLMAFQNATTATITDPPRTLGRCYELTIPEAPDQPGIIAQLEGPGRVRAVAATIYAIQEWAPNVILLVGTAGGFLPGKIKLGDILIAKSIIDYELQKIQGENTIFRATIYPMDRGLLEWSQKVAPPRLENVPRKPFVHRGAILSGDKVIASENARRQLLSHFPEAIGVEMEGAGVAFAAKQYSIPVLMIRGVADSAGDHKSKVGRLWHGYACESAARFAADFLRLWLQYGSTTSVGEKKI